MTNKYPESLVKRFWSNVRKTDGCWIWLGAHQSAGYGSIKYQGKPLLTHRLSWTLHYGEIPKGLYVCHHCDNTTCVNPAHLFTGTHLDNLRDMFNKGRNHLPPKHIGEDNNHAKLTDEQVIAIKVLLQDGMTSPQIAKLYGVTRSTIYHIKRVWHWKHIVLPKNPHRNKIGFTTRENAWDEAQRADKEALEKAGVEVDNIDP